MAPKRLLAAGSQGGSLPVSSLSRRFGENLLVARRRLSLSQQDTAQRAGLHHTEIGLLERGRRVPQLDTIVRVGGALEVEPWELLAGLAWRPARRIEGRPPAYVKEEAPIWAPAADRAGRS